MRLSVHAVGFGFPDALMVAGKYQVKPEVAFHARQRSCRSRDRSRAGRNERAASGARVLAMAGQGGLAEECIAPATALIPLPEAMSMAAAAGFLVNYGTTYHALVQRANSKLARRCSCWAQQEASV